MLCVNYFFSDARLDSFVHVRSILSLPHYTSVPYLALKSSGYNKMELKSGVFYCSNFYYLRKYLVVGDLIAQMLDECFDLAQQFVTGVPVAGSEQLNKAGDDFFLVLL